MLRGTYLRLLPKIAMLRNGWFEQLRRFLDTFKGVSMIEAQRCCGASTTWMNIAFGLPANLSPLVPTPLNGSIGWRSRLSFPAYRRRSLHRSPLLDRYE